MGRSPTLAEHVILVLPPSWRPDLNRNGSMRGATGRESVLHSIDKIFVWCFHLTNYVHLSWKKNRFDSWILKIMMNVSLICPRFRFFEPQWSCFQWFSSFLAIIYIRLTPRKEAKKKVVTVDRCWFNALDLNEKNNRENVNVVKRCKWRCEISNPALNPGSSFSVRKYTTAFTLRRRRRATLSIWSPHCRPSFIFENKKKTRRGALEEWWCER